MLHPGKYWELDVQTSEWACDRAVGMKVVKEGSNADPQVTIV